MSTFSYNTEMQSFKKTLLQLCLLYPELDCHLQHFLEFGNIFGFGWYCDWPQIFSQTDIVTQRVQFGWL